MSKLRWIGGVRIGPGRFQLLDRRARLGHPAVRNIVTELRQPLIQLVVGAQGSGPGRCAVPLRPADVFWLNLNTHRLPPRYPARVGARTLPPCSPPAPAIRSPARAQCLVEPISARARSQGPAGPLLALPFAALRDRSDKRLIERCALSTPVSLGALTWPANRRKPTTPLLVAADPLGPKGAPVRVALRAGFGPLKYARAEAEQVAKLFPGAVGLVGPQAREGAVKRQMQQCALLHFATHVELDEQDGLRSALLLAPEPLASPEDGRLEAREILGLPLAARLTVLSACHTGEGQPSGGEGLLGLAWAFRAAGCPSVVASQWAVDDQATGRLMLDFYRALKAGQPKDMALRQAMRAVRQSSGARSPALLGRVPGHR